MTGRFDGPKVTYFFGPRHGGETWKAHATSLQGAVDRFRVGVLFPEKYADKSDGLVPVHVSEHGVKGWTEAARIPARVEEDPVLLRMLSDAGGEGSTATALAVAGTGAAVQGESRTQIEEKMSGIQTALADLEAKKRELQALASVLHAELARRLEQIWVIELFLGSKERVKVLREGAPAPAGTPIAVRQRVLCMDEEYAVHQWLRDPEAIGSFDYKNLPEFDDWLLREPAALDVICPWPKGIVALRPRRERKDRGQPADFFEAMAQAEEAILDQYTYLLIRNGEQLYRIYVDVDIWPRFFASAADAEAAAHAEEFGNYHGRDAKKRMKMQMAGLVAVQGILERSTLLAPTPSGLSVFDPRCAESFNLVRDDEGERALADGADALAHVTWKDVRRRVSGEDDTAWDAQHELVRQGYESWLQDKVAPGVRVVYTGTITGHHDKGDCDCTACRTGSPNVKGPDPRRVYTLRKRQHGWPYRYDFLYLPEPWWEGDEHRQRRVAFGCRAYEVVPIDFVSWRVLEHLLRDRGQREHYGSFFRWAFRWWKLAKAEADRERPFVDLVLRAECVEDEPSRARVERLVRWWKLKTQEHRALSVDDSKAFRMVRAAFRRGEDYDDDPERGLFT